MEHVTKIEQAALLLTPVKVGEWLLEYPLETTLFQIAKEEGVDCRCPLATYYACHGMQVGVGPTKLSTNDGMCVGLPKWAVKFVDRIDETIQGRRWNNWSKLTVEDMFTVLRRVTSAVGN